MFCCADPGRSTREAEEFIPQVSGGPGQGFPGPADLTQEDIKAIRAQADSGGPRLLVLDRQVDPSGVLLDAVLPNVFAVSYDSEEDTTAELVGLIRLAHMACGLPFRSIAFANHGGEVWQLAVDCLAPMGDSAVTIAVAQPVLSALVAALTNGGRIDLLGCNLLELDESLVGHLETFYDKNFAASDDKTGNTVAGGNWIMESDEIDVFACYFDKQKVAEYKEVMWGTWDFIDCVPIVGAAARSGQAAVLAIKGDAAGANEAIANAALNLSGDALGLISGGSGKVAMVAARTGAKVLVKQGVKAAVKKVMKIGYKNVSKKLQKNYAMKYFKKKIKKKTKEAILKILKEEKETVRDEFENLLVEATGCDPNELKRLSNRELDELASTIAEVPDEDCE